MKHAALTIALLLSSAPALAQSGATIPHEFAVRLRPGETIADVADSYSAVVVAQYAPRRLYLLRATPDQDDGEIEAELELDDRLEEFEQNRENAIADGHTQSFFVGIAPGAYDKQPMWDTIGLCNPGLGEGGRGWSIAILDTGVFRHLRFRHQVRTDGASFLDLYPATSDGARGLDTNRNGVFDELAGHGTFMAGLITKLAPKCTILPVRVLDSDGVGTTFSVTAGIYYAVDHGAKIINVSLTSPVDTLTMREAIATANAAGAIVVCATGNFGDNVPQYPAALTNAVAVASTDAAGFVAPWSSVGPYVRFSAPGVEAVSTLPGNLYGRASGTSVSAALVSGAIARTVVARAGLLPTEALAQMDALTVDLNPLNPGYEGLIGRGLHLPSDTIRGPFITLSPR